MIRVVRNGKNDGTWFPCDYNTTRKYFLLPLVVFVPVPLPFLQAGFWDMSHVLGICPRCVLICPQGQPDLSFEI